MTIDEMELRQLRAEVERLRDEVRRWKSTAAEAANEIEDHWDAHCDAHGAGPVNLVRRLRGRPDEYGGPYNYRAVARRIEGFDE